MCNLLPPNDSDLKENTHTFQSKPGLMGQLLNGLNRQWRILATGFCFVVFGVGGVFLSLIWFNLLLLTEKDQLKRHKRARASISASFRLFFFCLYAFCSCVGSQYRRAGYAES